MTPLAARLREAIEKETIQVWHNDWDSYFVSAETYKQLQKLALLLPECVEALEYYAKNAGLRINFETNKFESSDCEDAKDFHGAKARAIVARIQRALEER